MVGICAKMGASPVNTRVLLKSEEDMKKDKTRHFETFSWQSYPKKLPDVGKLGKHDVNNGVFGQEPDVKNDKQPSLDEILEWLGNPDRE